MKKSLYIGNAKDYGKVVIEIELVELKSSTLNWEDLSLVPNGLRLSICGNARGTWGQIMDEIKEMEFKEMAIDMTSFYRLINIWKEYHLNDMKSGTKLQSEFLKVFQSTQKSYDYTKCKSILEQHHLAIDSESCPGYRYEYGSAWLFKPIPEDVKSFLIGLRSDNPGVTRSELLDWFISNGYKFTITKTDSNPNMVGNTNEMDHWLCTFYNPNDPGNMLRVHYSTGIGHRIGNRRMTPQEFSRQLDSWRRKVYAQLGFKYMAFPSNSKDKVSLKDLGFHCQVPTMVFSHQDGNPIPVPPMPDDVLNCIARESMDCQNHGDWMEWAGELGLDLNSKSERRKLQKAFLTMQDQADAFNSVFRDFPFQLVE